MFCSHREVVVAGQKKKLSVTKGIIGGLLLGPLGAVGGAAGLGKTRTMFTCVKCGKTFDHVPSGSHIVG
ncbi:hypothetical protein [uncultured Bifidobacterium sp.]|uniref:hypothetical protein n=1 Tax=uncultured Bifidobacterium sp. TaxID=165187 RepID=UPI0028DB5BE6|nr:hypothetical protein [uncultured Bifidobacterium sp.]